MLSMVALIPVGFGFAVWRATRAAKSRAERGRPYDPAGKIRWDDR